MIGSAILFIILGIVIKYGKMYFLIAGYNTMSPEEKKKYDIEGIANLFKNTFWAMALLILLGALISYLTQIPKIEFFCFWAAMAVGVPYLLILSNSKKYKKE